MILVYTGEGKGKTSASVGQAIRAHGQGLCVAFAQFMKRAGQAGEQVVLSQLLGDRFYAGGAGFFRKEETRATHREAAQDVLAWANKQAESVDMLVLDESLYALGSSLLLAPEIQNIIDGMNARKAHLVLSGRGVPDWLHEQADIITEMTLRKHPYASGQQATRGIEY